LYENDYSIKLSGVTYMGRYMNLLFVLNIDT